MENFCINFYGASGVAALRGDGTDETINIQKVLDRGGKIDFGEGTYAYTKIYVKSNTCITGVKGKTIFSALGNKSSDNNRVEIKDANNVTIRNITVTETNVTGRDGYYGALSGNNSTNITIDNVEVTASSGTGMHFLYCRKVDIDNCYVLGTQADGIHIQRGSQDFAISRSRVLDTGDDCIGFVSHGYAEYGYCKNILIIGCTLGDTHNSATQTSSGIALIGSIGAVVTGNIIRNTSLSGIRCTSFFSESEGNAVGGRAIIQNNMITNAGLYTGEIVGTVKDGITISNQRDVLVTNNLIKKAVGGGVVLSNSLIDVSVLDNKIYDVGTRGVWLAPLEQTGDYLNLWTDAEFDDGQSLAYVYAHRISIKNNNIVACGEDGIYAAGGAARNIDTLDVDNNGVYQANTTNGGGKFGIYLNYVSGLYFCNNKVGPGRNSITKWSIANIDLVNDNYINNNFPVDAGSSKNLVGINWHQSVGSVPTDGTHELGWCYWNWNPQAGQKLGWVCVAAGTMGTLSGITGSIELESATLIVNSATGLYIGCYITIAGVTGKKRVIAISGTTVTLGSTSDATVVTAAVAYSAAAFKAMATVEA